MIENIFKQLNATPLESTIYTKLLETSGSSAGVLAKLLNIPRPSIYVTLKKMLEKGLVCEGLKDGRKHFEAVHPEKIVQILDANITRQVTAKESLEQIIPQLMTHANKHVAPKLYYFEGAEGVRHVLRDMLLYRNIETFALWPIDEMLDVLGTEFFGNLNRERIKRNLRTRAIWPSKHVVDIAKNPFLGVGDDFKREIRKAPKELDHSLGYWSYANKVAFISSSKEGFGFIVESNELVQMLKSQFDLIWKLSKPISVDKKYVQEFLNSIT